MDNFCQRAVNAIILYGIVVYENDFVNLNSLQIDLIKKYGVQNPFYPHVWYLGRNFDDMVSDETKEHFEIATTDWISEKWGFEFYNDHRKEFRWRKECI